ncbi:guanitoxin biosynthesis heme-dependent pre-guanitoxin N-hydroxylase GntA [Croceibacterium ferulae]|uniref:guanitoxin biosynthesis heme-dependent pre-guanitoxin N-hydroxylase GntA n=1 Tax=Croceibacterium ferulae TaxID=1854641 RepID=UPI000EB0C02A|nr:guanitoxin biosynthesis heme-dependent pre-guanitoxin N-hydroxylase GntA [Croceibacterium ferulae]
MLIADDIADLRREELFAQIAEAGFPCVGAKSALARGTLKVIVGHSLESAWDDVKIHSELLEWAKGWRADPEGLRSLAVVYDTPTDLTEEQFEALLWERLQSLADKDQWRGQPYDQRVSSDPTDPHFSLSFGGEAFFVVGLHPGASRPARRFRHPTLVFNLHEQFEHLRDAGRYEKMRKTILQRDVALAGSVNPMLSRYGETSEARQYSGRQVGEDWTCPFHDKRSESAPE